MSMTNFPFTIGTTFPDKHTLPAYKTDAGSLDCYEMLSLSEPASHGWVLSFQWQLKLLPQKSGEDAIELQAVFFYFERGVVRNEV